MNFVCFLKELDVYFKDQAKSMQLLDNAPTMVWSASDPAEPITPSITHSVWVNGKETTFVIGGAPTLDQPAGKGLDQPAGKGLTLEEERCNSIPHKDYYSGTHFVREDLWKNLESAYLNSDKHTGHGPPAVKEMIETIVDLLKREGRPSVMQGKLAPGEPITIASEFITPLGPGTPRWDNQYTSRQDTGVKSHASLEDSPAALAGGRPSIISRAIPAFPPAPKPKEPSPVLVQEKFDSKSGKTYYWHLSGKTKGQSTWELPEGAKIQKIRRRLTNQRLIDRFIRESLRCQTS